MSSYKDIDMGMQTSEDVVAERNGLNIVQDAIADILDNASTKIGKLFTMKKFRANPVSFYTMVAIFFIFVPVLSFVFLILMIIEGDQNGIIVLSIMTPGSIFLAWIATLSRKRFLLSKILISDKGIECLLFRKQLLFIRWDEVTDVKRVMDGFLPSMAIFRGKEWIGFEPTKGKRDAMKEVAPAWIPQEVERLMRMRIKPFQPLGEDVKTPLPD